MLHVEDLQQRALHPFWQLLQLVIGCAQLPQTVAAEQPAAHENTHRWLKTVLEGMKHEIKPAATQSGFLGMNPRD